jgi:hypothetical protein
MVQQKETESCDGTACCSGPVSALLSVVEPLHALPDIPMDMDLSEVWMCSIREGEAEMEVHIRWSVHTRKIYGKLPVTSNNFGFTPPCHHQAFGEHGSSALLPMKQNWQKSSVHIQTAE